MAGPLMLEKICSYCGTTLLVGLHYCPGCLRAIDRGRGNEGAEGANLAQLADGDASPGPDSFFYDLNTIWSNLIYPIKALYHRLLGWPEPSLPSIVPTTYRTEGPRSTLHHPNERPALSLSPGFIRVICPNCQSALRAPLGFSPSEAVVCGVCSHEFPGCFAAEFRTGADLACARCGVTTFCVTGDKVTTCPNCRYSTEKVTARTRIKLKVIVAVIGTVFLGFLTHAFLTQTTTHFIVGTCLVLVGTVIGFIVMVALGF